MSSKSSKQRKSSKPPRKGKSRKATPRGPGVQTKFVESKSGRKCSKKNGLGHASPIHQYMKALKNQGFFEDRKNHLSLREIKTVHTGGVRLYDTCCQAADTSIYGSLVDMNSVYRFRLGGHATVGYSSGTLNTYFPCDPSASGLGFPEWTTLTALFSEFKLVSLTIQFTRQRQSNTDYGTQFNNPIIIAGNLGTAANPGSYSNLADNADCFMWSCAQDTSAVGVKHTLHGTGLNWSEVATPTTDPYAGAPGSIQMFGTATSGVPSDVIHCLVVGVYDFRSRV